MSFAAELKEELEKYNLLNHELYQYWNEGKLTKETLKEYAKQYFHHVENFPRCLSAMHSLCDSVEARKIILENLVDEESANSNHPELWLDFAKGLGVEREAVKTTIPNKFTKHLLDTFKNNSRSSYEEGIGSLYAHEWQYSKIAETKKMGLEKFYAMTSEEELKFFTVHSDVDVWHAQQLTTLLDKLPVGKREKVRQGAVNAAQALWGFLDGILEYHHA
jgi:pyrroloquinoline-quinone synthase